MLSELIGASLNAGDVSYLQRLNHGLLFDTESAAVKWITSYFRKFKTAPTADRFEKEPTHGVFLQKTMNRYPLQDVWEMTVEFLRARFAANVHQEVERVMAEGGAFPIDYYMKSARFLTSVSASTNVKLTDFDREDMYSGNALDAAVDFGFDFLDNNLGGILPGEIFLIVARTGVGKTMLMCRQMVRWARMGKKVLLASMEMRPQQLMNRIDGLLGGFNPRIFRNPKADKTQLALLKATVERELMFIRDAGGDVIFTKPGPVTPEFLEGEIDEHKPDVVGVDGVYLMQGEGGRSSASWERVKASSNALKQIAMASGLPFVTTSQFNRAQTAEGQGLEQIGYSDALAQDADMVLGLVKGEGQAIVAELLKARDGQGSGSMILTIDWTHMLMEEKPLTLNGVLLKGGSGVTP